MNNKKTVLTLLLFICSIAGFAQDTLYYKTGAKQSVKVTEITPTEVKFKKQSQPDGPTYTILKSDLYRIRYSSGEEDIFSTPAEQTTTTTNSSSSGTSSLNTPAEDDIPEQRHYGGPRIGLTFVGPGAFETALLAEGKRTVYSQFGWQFETRMFTLKSGLSGLFEFVPLIGGMDMGKFIPSMSAMVGMRTSKGYEFGAGPNFAVYFGRNQYGGSYSSANFGIVIAGGMSLKVDKVYFPINLAFVPSVSKSQMVYDVITQTTVPYHYQTGVKFTLLVGFNNRVK